MTSYKIGIDSFHYYWNNEHKPVIRIKSGDEVHFEVNEVTSWQITKEATIENLLNMDSKKLYPLSGPVYVEGASEGDALSVEVKHVKTADWGWSSILSGLGLLPEYSDPFLWIWDLSKDEEFVEFKNGIRVPKAPFCGVLGVAPKEKGSFEVMPPGKHGGNMDIKHLTEGSMVLLPVWTEGALFSVGDIHAAMGDGEVCVTAIECPGEVSLKFELVKDARISSPRFVTSKGTNSNGGSSFVTTGIGPDLIEACRSATRNMIDYLVRNIGLDKNEAYILCSVAGDLKVHEVVDAPNWVVGMWMRESVLGSK
jgi:acetamidase/formamidase